MLNAVGDEARQRLLSFSNCILDSKTLPSTAAGVSRPRATLGFHR